MYLGIGKVAVMIGVSISTLRRWDKINVLSASYRTAGGHRRYKLVKILLFCKNIGRILSSSHQIPETSLRVVFMPVSLPPGRKKTSSDSKTTWHTLFKNSNGHCSKPTEI